MQLATPVLRMPVANVEAGQAPEVKSCSVKLEVDAHVGRSWRVTLALAEQEDTGALAGSEACQRPPLSAGLRLHPQNAHTARQPSSGASNFAQNAL